MAVLVAAVLLVGLLVGYGAALLTATPLVDAFRERLRVERETRLAELQLRQMSHQAMQRMLQEARNRQ